MHLLISRIYFDFFLPGILSPDAKTHSRFFSKCRWFNASEQRHQWYEKCGNDILYHHAQNGALSDMKKWNQTNSLTPTTSSEPLSPYEPENFAVLFSTGAVYVNYMASSGLSYVLKTELITAAEVMCLMKSSLLFLTSLKLMACDKCAPGHKIRPGGNQYPDAHSDLAMLKLPKLPNIHPFQFAEDPGSWLQYYPLTISESRKQQIDLFKRVTGVDPEVDKILALVCLNVRDLMHIFRRIWQDYGPFPIIGCDSEGLAWHLRDKDPKILQAELTMSTSGFVITENKDYPMSVASLVFSVQDDVESKLKQLKDAGSHSQNSWGIALSSCMRGYDGDDITNEHIEAKDAIQKRECQLFHDILGDNYIGAQVEDVFGTNHLDTLYKTAIYDSAKADVLGLFTPDIHADDSSTVLFVAGQFE